MTPMENNVIARTGRVQNWIDDPTSRLPVSCTVFVVEDSMEGENGIEASWRFVSHALRYGAGVAGPSIKTATKRKLTMAAASLHQARCHLVRSTAVSTNSSEEEVSIRMGL